MCAFKSQSYRNQIFILRNFDSDEPFEGVAEEAFAVAVVVAAVVVVAAAVVAAVVVVAAASHSRNQTLMLA